jgi:Fic family protein
MNKESQEANRSIAHRKGSDCAVILANLRLFRAGKTCEELERITKMKHQTCSARLRDLFLEGAIVRTGIRRPTESGRMAVVWKVAPKPLEPCICA